MFVQTEVTPNPNSLKFLPGKKVSNSGPYEITNKELKKNWETILRLLFFIKPDFLNFLITNYCIATTSLTSGK